MWVGIAAVFVHGFIGFGLAVTSQLRADSGSVNRIRRAGQDHAQADPEQRRGSDTAPDGMRRIIVVIMWGMSYA